MLFIVQNLNIQSPNFKYIVRTRCNLAGGPANWYLHSPGEIDMSGVERLAGGPWGRYIGDQLFRHGGGTPVGKPFFVQFGQEPLWGNHQDPQWVTAIYGDPDAQTPPIWYPAATVHAGASLAKWLRANFLPEHWPNFPFDMAETIRTKFGNAPRPRPSHVKLRSAMRAESLKVDDS